MEETTGKVRAILDIALKAMVPFLFVFMGWLSLQIIETDRTQEVVLGELKVINRQIMELNLELKNVEAQIKVLPAQLHIGDRWTGTMQDLWGDPVIDRLNQIEQDQKRFLWNRR